MVAALVGDNDFNDYYEFCNYIQVICKKHKLNITHIVTSDTAGVGSLALQYALDNNITFYIYKTNWKGLGKRAPAVRDNTIITNSQFCIVFSNNSNKTYNSIKAYSTLCNKQNKKCYIYYGI